MRQVESMSDERSCDIRLRIALVTETYPPEINGVALTLRKMVEGLILRGHDVQLVRPRQSANEREVKAPSFEELLVKGARLPRYEGLRFGLPARALLMNTWSGQMPDVVHVATEGPLGWSAVSAALGLGIPVTSDLHTNFDHYSQHYGVGWLKGAVAAYLKRFHNRTAVTFVPTVELADALHKRGYHLVDVVARGVDARLFAPLRRSQALRHEWGVGPNDLAVVHVGRIAAEKNLELVLRAFSAIQGMNPAARLILVGDGPMRAALSRERPDVVFAGMRTGEDLAAHYASSDLFLFPSLSETFGNVVLEAMASGLTVLAYHYAAAAEAICSGTNGITVPRNDEAAFVERALRLASDSALRLQLGDRARTSCTERFTWDKVNDRFEAALKDVCRTAAGMRPAAAADVVHAPAVRP